MSNHPAVLPLEAPPVAGMADRYFATPYDPATVAEDMGRVWVAVAHQLRADLAAGEGWVIRFLGWHRFPEADYEVLAALWTWRPATDAPPVRSPTAPTADAANPD